MFRTASISLIALTLSGTAAAGFPGAVPMGFAAAPMGSELGMPTLAVIATVGLVAGIRYLRNKRS